MVDDPGMEGRHILWDSVTVSLLLPLPQVQNTVYFSFCQIGFFFLVNTKHIYDGLHITYIFYYMKLFQINLINCRVSLGI